jgi:hypothetical protein
VLSELLRGQFNGMYKRYATYRVTGGVLMVLVQYTQIQYSLFETPIRAEKIRELYGRSAPSAANTGSTPSASAPPTPSKTRVKADREHSTSAN